MVLERFLFLLLGDLMKNKLVFITGPDLTNGNSPVISSPFHFLHREPNILEMRVFLLIGDGVPYLELRAGYWLHSFLAISY
jgi:hypothetical protein